LKKKIVISAINFRSGGPLSILNDCLTYIDGNLTTEYEIVALVHSKTVIVQTANIQYIEFPKSINSYFLRFYYEYFHFKKLSRMIKPHLWLSLHDMSPRVEADIKAVYCHNPSPFYRLRFKDLIVDRTFFLFVMFYRYLYRINIKQNDFVIVQQNWIRENFLKMFKIKNCIVAYPNIDIDSTRDTLLQRDSTKIRFLYPSFPRVFKNFEVVCEAAKILNDNKIFDFEILLTIDGTENKYSADVYKKYRNVPSLNFIGLQSRADLFNLYSTTDCLIFASKLETWGLPITEFKKFNRLIIVSDLEYARETVGDYKLVKFFNPTNADMLSKLIKRFLSDEFEFDQQSPDTPENPFTQSWDELFEILLDERSLNATEQINWSVD